MSSGPTTENPYESPGSESHSPEAPPREKHRPRFAWLLLPLIGAVSGSMLLAPFVRCPGDPFGHSIGAGLGLLAGLVLGIVLRVLAVKRQEASGSDTAKRGGASR